MAKNLENEDLDLGEAKPNKKKLLVIIAVSALLLIGGGVAAYLVWVAGESADDLAQAQGDDAHTEAAEQPKGPAIYHRMDPVFVVNLPGQPSLLQVGVSVRVTSEQMVEFIKHNDPMIRHHLLNLLQRKQAKALMARAAKEELQTEMLNEMNRVVRELSGPGEIDALYFTSFVMQ